MSVIPVCKLETVFRWLIGAVVCLLAANRGSNPSSKHAVANYCCHLAIPPFTKWLFFACCYCITSE